MQHPSTAALYGYWARQRGAAPAPRRSAIEPGPISPLLGDIFILEASADGRFPFRLAGTRLCASVGRELTGEDFRSLWLGTDGPNMASLLRSITAEAAAIEFRLDCRNDRGQALAAEMLLLPMRQHGAAIDRILGLTVPLERPYWLGLHPLARQTIAQAGRITPEATWLSPPTAVAATPVPAASPRPHLVVLDGGKR